MARQIDQRRPPSSIVTGGASLSAVTLQPLVEWSMNGFQHPIPPSVPFVVSAVIVTLSHLAYNITVKRRNG